ncbi:MAG: S41 family peptidase [Moorellaceae bacterium]
MLKTGRRGYYSFFLCWLFLYFYFLAGDIAVAQEGDGVSTPWPLLDEVRYIIESSYAGDVDPYLLEEGAVEGMMEALGDPYSEYLSPAQVKIYQRLLEEEYSGVGMVLKEENHVFTVQEVIASSPAARQGIKPGGVLLKVDGRALQGLSLNEVLLLLRGEPGTQVTVEIAWPWEPTPRAFTLTREMIRQPAVQAHLLEGEIGYLALRSFTSTAPTEVAEGLAELLQGGARGLILDLRGNSGGYLQSAVKVASLFLLKGLPVAQVVDKKGRVEILRSEGPGLDLPVVVLVDRDTASAAELLAGALQDAGVAVLVGSRTFGKGSIQTLIPLTYGGALKLTTNYYLTPSGRKIHGQGLKPDWEVTDPEEQLRTAVGLLQSQLPSAA